MKYENTDALLAWLMVWMSKTFPTQAILKGGMVLRLLESIRNTNDLNWVFIPFESRKEVAPLIRSELDKINELTYLERLDSRSLQYQIEFGGQRGQLEISVTDECKSIAISSAHYASQFGLVGGLVRVMEPSVALSHRLAAWNERRLYRDLFDIWFISRVLKVDPDVQTLLQRLKRVEHRRKKPSVMSTHDFCVELNNAADSFNMQEFREELVGSMKESEIDGMEIQIPLALRLIAMYLLKMTHTA